MLANTIKSSNDLSIVNDLRNALRIFNTKIIDAANNNKTKFILRSID
jgi:hypothetical protein